MKRRFERVDESIARYLSKLETADRHGDAEVKVERLKGKIEKLKEDIVRLNAINAENEEERLIYLERRAALLWINQAPDEYGQNWA
jgi:hypothetical protein